MILYRITYETLHDMGGWVSVMEHRANKKEAEALKKKVIKENSEFLEQGNANIYAGDDALKPKIEKIEIKTKKRLLQELSLAASSGAI